MKFNTLFKSLVPVFLVVSTGLQAHYFRSSKLSDNALVNTQEIITWGDYHHSSTPENKEAIRKQKSDIIEYAKALNAAIIVEDGITLSAGQELNDNPDQVVPVLTKDELERYPLETPLHGLASSCALDGVACTNVEFRFTQSRPLHVFCRLLENKKKNFENYNDGASFNAYYRKKLDQLKNLIEIPCKSLFDQWKTSSLTIDQYCSRKTVPVVASVDTILKTLYGSDTDLSGISYNQKVARVFKAYCCAFIDLDILHAIAQYKDYKTVFICAGDFHIECIKDALIEIGYYHQVSCGADEIIKTGLDCVEPQAIDIEATMIDLQVANGGTLSSIIALLALIITLIASAIAYKTISLLF